jgi:hypothetical protein
MLRKEGMGMRYGLVVLVICLGIIFDLGLYIASSDDAFATFDPRHPATILPILANRYRDLRAQMGEVVRGLVDGFAAPVRERARRDVPAEAPPR